MALLRKILILWLFALPLSATNYYVKNGGNDAFNGSNDALAWNTITKVNTEWAAGTFAAGDTIFFKRDDSFSGTITVTEAGTSGTPIVISAYGTGADPIITGLETLTSWTSVGDTIYYATLTGGSACEMVTIDGVQYAKGRWPNNTWITVTSRPSTSQIIATSLGASPDWDGAEMVIRENRWTMTRHTVTDHSTTSVTFTPVLTYNPTGYGFFFQNDLETLDTFGEWYHDHAANRLYIHMGDSTIGSYVIKASDTDYGVNIGTYENITITGLSFTGFNKAAIYASFGDYDAHGITVDDCNISFSGGDAIYINRSSGDTITNNTISYSNHCSITLWGNFGTGCLVDGNTISYSGTILGGAFNAYGATAANNAYDAIYTNPDKTTITDNVITYTGYIPINYRGDSALVQHNYISHYCYVKDDGAGIYVYDCTDPGKRVLDNIILYGLGASGGMATGSQISAHGIYTDGEASNVHFEGNVIGHMAKAGYHGNLPTNITIIDNKFFDCVQFLNLWKYYSDGNFMENLRIVQNDFVTAAINEELPAMIFYQNSSGEYDTDIETEIAAIGTIDSNYYYINTECAVHVILSDTAAAPQSMDRWITRYSQDSHSTIEVMDTYTLNSIGSNLLSNGTFDSNITGWSATTGASVAWDNTDELGSGGSIEMTSTENNYGFYWWSNNITVTTAISGGVIDSDNHYLLRFLGKSAVDDKTIGLKLYSTGTGLTKQRFFTVGNTNTQKDVLFSYPADVASGATMRLALCDDPVATYFDNVGLYVADVTLTDFDSYLHFLYNETGSAKTYYPSATMTEPDGTEYTTSITIQPWTGAILIGNGTLSEMSPAPEGGTGPFTKIRAGKFAKSSNGNFAIIR